MRRSVGLRKTVPARTVGRVRRSTTTWLTRTASRKPICSCTASIGRLGRSKSCCGRGWRNGDPHWRSGLGVAQRDGDASPGREVHRRRFAKLTLRPRKPEGTSYDPFPFYHRWPPLCGGCSKLPGADGGKADESRLRSISRRAAFDWRARAAPRGDLRRPTIGGAPCRSTAKVSLRSSTTARSATFMTRMNCAGSITPKPSASSPNSPAPPGYWYSTTRSAVASGTASTGRLGRRASRSRPSTTTIRSNPARNASAI